MSALESFLDACCVDKTSNLITTKIPKLALKKMDDGDFYVDNQAYMELWNMDDFSMTNIDSNGQMG